MKLKKLGFIMVLTLALIFLVGLVGCDWSPVTPEPIDVVETLSADVEIINWVQNEGEVEVTYEIINTGTVDIAYYKILLAVTYEGGSVYTIWHEKIGIAFADTEVVKVIIGVSDEVVRINIADLKLTEWKW